MKTYRNDPRKTNARFDCVCAESGHKIKKGDAIIYWPSDRTVYLIGKAAQAEKEYQEFLCSAMDESAFNGDTW